MTQGELSEALQVFALGDDDDAVLGDGEPTLEVGFAVPADLEPARNVDFFVDNCPANTRVAARRRHHRRVSHPRPVQNC